jgi:membrane protein involved in colicin uptake
VIVEDATLASLGAPPEEVQAEAQLRAKEEARRQQQAEKEATKKAKDAAKKSEEAAKKPTETKKEDSKKKKAEESKKKPEEATKSQEQNTVKAENKGKGKIPSFGKKDEPKFNTQQVCHASQPAPRAPPSSPLVRALSRWASPKARTFCPATARCA